MVGRKRKPTTLHIVEGTDRPDRVNPAEPRLLPDAPRALRELLDEPGRKWFSRLRREACSMRVAASVDGAMLTLLSMRLAEIQRCNGEIEKDGATYSRYELVKIPGKDDRPVVKAQRMIRPHPAVAQRSEAARHAQALLAEFGLSPASRAKVSAASGKDEADDPWKLIANSR